MNLLRRSVEYISRKLVFKRTLPFPFDKTKIYTTPDSALKYLKIGKAGFDQDLLMIVERYVGVNDVIWDIGANVGLFGFAASQKNGGKHNIYLVEPDVKLANIISKSIKENSDRSVDLLVAAIADEVGITKLKIAERGRSSNFINLVEGRTMSGGVRSSYYIPMLTLDYLSEKLKKPDFIKIDVEGAELLVLKGGAKLLNDIKPTIYCEVGNNVAKEVLSLMQQHGYEIYDPNRKITDNNKLNECLYNSLFIHKSKVHNYRS